VRSGRCGSGNLYWPRPGVHPMSNATTPQSANSSKDDFIGAERHNAEVA
jgi:hypothetical protein